MNKKSTKLSKPEIDLDLYIKTDDIYSTLYRLTTLYIDNEVCSSDVNHYKPSDISELRKLSKELVSLSNDLNTYVKHLDIFCTFLTKHPGLSLSDLADLLSDEIEVNQSLAEAYANLSLNTKAGFIKYYQ